MAIATEYYIDHAVFLTWFISLCISYSYLLYKRVSDRYRTGMLAYWMGNFGMIILILYLTICYDYRGVYNIIPVAVTWHYSCVNSSFIYGIIAVYLYYTLETCYVSVQLKFKGEVKDRLRRYRYILTSVVVTTCIAGNGLCIAIYLTDLDMFAGIWLLSLAALTITLTTLLNWWMFQLRVALLRMKTSKLMPSIRWLERLSLLVLVVGIITSSAQIWTGIIRVSDTDKKLYHPPSDKYEFINDYYNWLILVCLSISSVLTHRSCRLRSIDGNSSPVAPASPSNRSMHALSGFRQASSRLINANTSTESTDAPGPLVLDITPANDGGIGSNDALSNNSNDADNQNKSNPTSPAHSSNVNMNHDEHQFVRGHSSESSVDLNRVLSNESA